MKSRVKDRARENPRASVHSVHVAEKYSTHVVF